MVTYWKKLPEGHKTHPEREDQNCLCLLPLPIPGFQWVRKKFKVDRNLELGDFLVNWTFITLV